MDKHIQHEFDVCFPLYNNAFQVLDPQSNFQNTRKHTVSGVRRPSMLSLGIRHVRGLSRSFRSVTDNDLKFEAIRFAHTTTAHGIPMALNAHAWYSRLIWLCLSICSLSIFFYQSYFVLQKWVSLNSDRNSNKWWGKAYSFKLKNFNARNSFRYHRKDKIVNVEVSWNHTCISNKHSFHSILEPSI